MWSPLSPCLHNNYHSTAIATDINKVTMGVDIASLNQYHLSAGHTGKQLIKKMPMTSVPVTHTYINRASFVGGGGQRGAFPRPCRILPPGHQNLQAHQLGLSPPKDFPFSPPLTKFLNEAGHSNQIHKKLFINFCFGTLTHSPMWYTCI